MTNASFLICPECYGALVQQAQALHCQSCQQTYPLIDDSFAAMFVKPKQAMFEAALSLQNITKKYKVRQNRAQQLIEQGKRLDAMQTIVQGDQHRLQLINQLQAKLNQAGLNNEMVSQVEATQNSHYDFHFGYLLRDWTFVEQYETQFQHQLAQLTELFAKYPLTGNVLMPGAASGRLPLELANCYSDVQVHAIESVFSSVALYYQLLKQDMEIYAFSLKNVVNPKHISQAYQASIPSALKSAATRMHYQWADYRALPYKTHSMDAIISVFFTDVMPLPVMLRETQRVLKRGGYFVHYGPLTWHFNDFEYCYSLEEFIAQMHEQGFVLRHQSQAAMLHEAHGDPFLPGRLSFEIGYLNFNNSLLLFEKI